MSCMNAFVHGLHHCTKSTRCSFGVVTQTSIGINFRVGSV